MKVLNFAVHTRTPVLKTHCLPHDHDCSVLIQLNLNTPSEM